MPKLCQIIAVEKSIKKKAEDGLTTAYHQIQKEDLFRGLTRTYAPVAEDGEERPPEKVLAQMRATDLLAEIARVVGELMDTTLTKDVANASAKADLVCLGQTLATGVPVTNLLFLEKKLVDIHTFVSKLPKLDPSEAWSFDAASNIYKSEPSKTNSTKKTTVPVVLSPATDKHPAQVKEAIEERLVGTWTTIKFSGALPQKQIADILGRVEALQKAVKFAREECNLAPVEPQALGGRVFAFLFQ